jgi:hypothetical protein
LADSPAGNALDGLESTVWNAGAGPPQWIEIDLGQEHNIHTIRLTVAQSPDGFTEHQLYIGEQQGDLLLLHTFSGETGEGSGMEFFRSAPLEGIRFIRIVTVTSPSWVAWREIEVIGE